MMRAACLVLLIAIAALQVNAANVYGITYTWTGNMTLAVLETVKVGSDGTLTPIVQNFIQVGGGLTFDGISSFDEKLGIFYYTTDYETAFVFPVNVQKGVVLAPYSIDALNIAQIIVDQSNNQLFVTGVYENETQVIISIPVTSGQAAEVLNFTDVGIKNVFRAAYDDQKQVYHFTYYDDNEDISLASFEVSNPTKISYTKTYPCKYGLPIFMEYDQKNGIVGFEMLSANGDLDYHAFHITPAGKCTETKMPVTGIALAGAYDFAESTLYFSFTNSSGYYLGTYDGSDFKVIETEDILVDIGVM